MVPSPVTSPPFCHFLSEKATGNEPNERTCLLPVFCPKTGLGHGKSRFWLESNESRSRIDHSNQTNISGPGNRANVALIAVVSSGHVRAAIQAVRIGTDTVPVCRPYSHSLARPLTRRPLSRTTPHDASRRANQKQTSIARLTMIGPLNSLGRYPNT